MSFDFSIFFQLLFCVSSCLILQVFAQLNNPCRHNEFRCSDGSKCLVTEKLCDGHRDCPRGEDERGSPQWDCDKLTLSSDCDQKTQTKCRYGGCISKTQQCDGVPDCWGGNDESVDLCPHRNSDIPNQEPRTPSSQSLQTKNSSPNNSGCPPLSDEHEGYQIDCENDFSSVNCTNPRRLVPTGTTARYTCKEYYRPPVGSRQRESVCKEDGSWTPLRGDFFCSLECGEGGYDQATFIVGGEPSKQGKWPWQVALYQEVTPHSGNWEYYCGGSLIAPNAVLTAAHCATMLRTEIPRNPRDIRIMLGKFYRSFARREQFMQLHRAKQIYVHEYYNSMTVDNDIAIIILEKNAVMNGRVHPVCLPDPKIDVVQPDDDNLGYLAGWGRSVNNEFKEELQEAKLPVISNKRCRDAHPTLASIVRRTTFCAGYLNGTSACDGDSGSPLVFSDKSKFKVQGIVSAGIPKKGGGCQNSYYTAFTKVVEYRDWIDSTLDSFSRRR